MTTAKSTDSSRPCDWTAQKLDDRAFAVTLVALLALVLILPLFSDTEPDAKRLTIVTSPTPAPVVIVVATTGPRRP